MNLFYLLVAPGFLWSLTIGLLASWYDRKITARLQWRQGPPIFQPLTDLIKLFGKEVYVPDGGLRWLFLLAPLLAFSAVLISSTILGVSNLDISEGFIGDLIVVVYLLTVPSLALILAGSASRNPLAALGASREMKLILAYELPFLLALFTLLVKVRSVMLGDFISYQATVGWLGFSFSGLIAFIVVLLVFQAKIGLVPFDLAEAEQELMAGPLLEYSGAPLALFRAAKAMLYYVLPLLLITLFWGGGQIGWPGALALIIKYVIILTLMVLVKNTAPRLRIDQAVRFFWGPWTLLALLGLILALLGY
ncbi:MAG: complex I subunit 1 family protein [Candidatus Margulisiibacteriota bacterium]|jgi:NADH-quinone oxidoreductase subunit H